jgi:hypothetical protein
MEVNTENKAIRSNLILSILFFVVALAIYISYSFEFPHPIFAEVPAEVRTNIKNLQDIDKLRNLALKMEEGIRAERKSSNALLESGIDALITLSLVTGFLSLVNAGSWRRFSLEQRKQKIPWWLKLFC